MKDNSLIVYLRALLLACALTCFAALLAPKIAYSHAELIHSSPGNGEQWSTPPTELILYFSEGVQTGEVGLLDSDGAALAVSAPVIDPADRRTAQVHLPPLEEGIYTARWQMLAEDGHITGSSFFFVVGDEMPTRDQFLAFLLAQAAPPEPVLQPLEPLARGFLFLMLALLVGIPVTWGLVMLPAQRLAGVRAPGDRLLRWSFGIAGGGVLAASLLLVGGQYTAVVGEWRAARFAEFLTATPGGNLALLRLVVALVLLTGGALRIGRGALLWLAGACGAILALTVNRGSHAAALLPDVGAWIDLGHLMAAGAWGGGLALLAWLAMPNVVRRIQQENEVGAGALLAAATARFSILALAAVSLAVASGLLLAAWFLPGWDALWRTLYGSTLSAKLGLLAVAVSLGALHRYRHLPRLEAHAGAGADRAAEVRRFAWSIRAEAVAVAGIMLLSGLLTSAPPATTVMKMADDGPVERGHTVQGHLGQRAMQIEMIPFQVGLNVFDVQFSDAAPQPENLTLLLRLPAQDVELPSFDLHEVEPGLWSTVGALPVAGEWQVRASAFVDGSFQAERFTLALAHDGHTHESEHDHTHNHEDGEDGYEADADAMPSDAGEPEMATSDAGFTGLLRLGAALVLGAGLGVVLFDLRRMRRRSQ